MFLHSMVKQNCLAFPSLFGGKQSKCTFLLFLDCPLQVVSEWTDSGLDSCRAVSVLTPVGSPGRRGRLARGRDSVISQTVT